MIGHQFQSRDRQTLYHERVKQVLLKALELSYASRKIASN